MLLLLVWFVPKVFTVVGHAVLMPVHAVENWFMTSQSSLPYFFRDRKELIDEINNLRAKPPTGVADHLAVVRLEAENEELRSLFNGEDDPRIVSGVIGRPNVTPYDILILDKGEAEGIVLGAPVYISNDTVVGFISQLNEHSSQVTLVTSPNFKSTVYIYGPNIYTTAVGVGGGILRVGVPQGIVLNEGDVVVLPSVKPGIFGQVDVIESSPTEPEQYGFVTTHVPINSLHLVAVGASPVESRDYDFAQSMIEDTYRDLFVVPVPEGVLVDLSTTIATSSKQSATSSGEVIIESDE